jgi:lipid-A-disaccharide synthase
MSRRPRIMLSAGEASGDRLGAGLARALRRSRPEIELFGMGGEEMANAGVEIIQDSSKVAVMGFLEVLSHLPALRAAKRRLLDCLDNRDPDLLVPIDFPDFNFILSSNARRRDVPVVYFVSPQVWAWRRGRVHKIRRMVRRILVLFPFEVGFYTEAGVPVSFVGHPVVERVPSSRTPEDLRRELGFDPDATIVALLPGSRRNEIDHLLPVLLEAAAQLRQERPDLVFLVPLAPGLPREVLERHVQASGLTDCRVHEGDFPDILRACATGAVASGTASLEAAMVGLPMVVVYRVRQFSYNIGRALVRVDHIALPNLVAGRRVVPELVQKACTPEAVAAHLKEFLDRPELVTAARDGLAEVRKQLGEPGVFDRAAAAVLSELDAMTASRAERGDTVDSSGSKGGD